MTFIWSPAMSYVIPNSEFIIALPCKGIQLTVDKISLNQWTVAIIMKKSKQVDAEILESD